MEAVSCGQGTLEGDGVASDRVLQQSAFSGGNGPRLLGFWAQEGKIGERVSREENCCYGGCQCWGLGFFGWIRGDLVRWLCRNKKVVRSGLHSRLVAVHGFRVEPRLLAKKVEGEGLSGWWCC